MSIMYNYYVDYQTTQTVSRTNVTSKMEQFVTIFDSSRSLTIVTQISILGVIRRARSDFHYRHFCFAEMDLNQFEVNFPFF